MTIVKRYAQWNLFYEAVVLSCSRNAVSVKAQCAPAAAIILLRWLRTADTTVISASLRYSIAVGKYDFLSNVFERFPDVLYILCLSTRQNHFQLLWYRPPPVIRWNLFLHQTRIGWRHLLQCCSYSSHRSDMSLHFISSDRINDPVGQSSSFEIHR